MLKLLILISILFISTNCNKTDSWDSTEINPIQFPDKLRTAEENGIKYIENNGQDLLYKPDFIEMKERDFLKMKIKMILPKNTLNYNQSYHPERIAAHDNGKILLSEYTNYFHWLSYEGKIKIFSQTGSFIKSISTPSIPDKLLFRGNTLFLIVGNHLDHLNDTRYIQIHKTDILQETILSYEKIEFPMLIDAAVDEHENLYLATKTDLFQLSSNGAFRRLNILKSVHYSGIKIDPMGNFWIIYYKNTPKNYNEFKDEGCQILIYNKDWQLIKAWKPSTPNYFNPKEIVFDMRGNIYILNHSLVRIFEGSKKYYSTKIKSEIYKYNKDFIFVNGWDCDSRVLATDKTSYLYAVDSINNNQSLIRYNFEGKIDYTWSNSSCTDGRFSTPSGVATGINGNIYVKDECYEGRVQKFDINGNFLKSWIKDDYENLGKIPQKNLLYSNKNPYIAKKMLITENIGFEQYEITHGVFSDEWMKKKFKHKIPESRLNKKKIIDSVAKNSDEDLIQLAKLFKNNNNFTAKNIFGHLYIVDRENHRLVVLKK